MVQYLLLARYSDEELKALVNDPARLAMREGHAKTFYGAFDGRLIQGYFIHGVKWHFAAIVEFKDAASAQAAMMAGEYSGGFAEGELHQLIDLKDATQILEKSHAGLGALYPPPPES